MLSLKDIKIETKLRLLVGVSVLGLLSFAVVSYITIAKVKVGGLVQTEVKLYSDLAADTMPPALDFERVRFAARDMLIFNSRKLPEKIALYNQRKQEYEDAVANWSSVCRKAPFGNCCWSTPTRPIANSCRYVKTASYRR